MVRTRIVAISSIQSCVRFVDVCRYAVGNVHVWRGSLDWPERIANIAENRSRRRTIASSGFVSARRLSTHAPVLGQKAKRTTNVRRHQVSDFALVRSMAFSLIFFRSFDLGREFLHATPPPLVKAIAPYMNDGRLTIDQADIIAVIDGRPDLLYIKGQNQRTFDIGTFPR